MHAYKANSPYIISKNNILNNNKLGFIQYLI